MHSYNFLDVKRILDFPTLRQKILPAATRIHRVKREEAQNAVAISMKRSDPTIFKVGDAVRISLPALGKWIHTGQIMELVLGQDGVARSYLVRFDRDEGQHYRHASYLRHLV